LVHDNNNGEGLDSDENKINGSLKGKTSEAIGRRKRRRRRRRQCGGGQMGFGLTTQRNVVSYFLVYPRLLMVGGISISLSAPARFFV